MAPSDEARDACTLTVQVPAGLAKRLERLHARQMTLSGHWCPQSQTLVDVLDAGLTRLEDAFTPSRGRSVG